MAKKKQPNILAISLRRSIQEKLEEIAKANGTNRSELVRNLILTYLADDKKITIVKHDEDTVPVVFRVPKSILSSRETIRNWLKVRIDPIVERLVAAKAEADAVASSGPEKGESEAN